MGTEEEANIFATEEVMKASLKKQQVHKGTSMGEGQRAETVRGLLKTLHSPDGRKHQQGVICSVVQMSLLRLEYLWGTQINETGEMAANSLQTWKALDGKPLTSQA